MNEVEAIKILKEDYKYCGDSDYDVWMEKRHAYKTALESLEKQMPRKVIYKSRTLNLRHDDYCELTKQYCEVKHNIPQPENSEAILNSGHCPLCQATCELGGQKYCGNCGQKLSWEVAP